MGKRVPGRPHRAPGGAAPARGTPGRPRDAPAGRRPAQTRRPAQAAGRKTKTPAMQKRAPVKKKATKSPRSPAGRVRPVEEMGSPALPGNRSPVIRPPKNHWMKNFIRWLLEDTKPDHENTQPQVEPHSEPYTEHYTEDPNEHYTEPGSEDQSGSHPVPYPEADAPDDPPQQTPRPDPQPTKTTRRKKAARSKRKKTHTKKARRSGSTAPSAGGAMALQASDNPAHTQKVDSGHDHEDRQKTDDRVDWRWLVHRFFKSNQRIMVGTRTVLVIALLVFTAWFSVITVTGFDITQTAVQSTDPEDPSTWYRTPFFIVESGSMMHPDDSFGRLGTIDPGDVVVIERTESVEGISTFYGPGEEKHAGARGDVLVFIPPATRENPFPQPVVHRAVAYLERDIIQIPNPDPRPGGSSTVSVPRFTVEEFGIYDARSVNIPELGLHNYQPDRSGFLTRGDNPRTNDLADQALGVTVHPVEMDRVLGRVTTQVPYVGLARIALMGQDQSQLSPDEQWCSFLAGQAPCDNWVIFLGLVYVFVGIPFLITLSVFTGRFTKRWRERRQFQQEQEEALARAEHARKEKTEGDPDTAIELEVHDALDLLAGRLVPTGFNVAPRKQEWVRMDPGLHLHEGESSSRDPSPQID